MSKIPMRGNLSKQFLKRLTDGDLHYIIKSILADKTLDVQVRDNFLNVYYRGGNILRIKPQSLYFDKFYFYLGHTKGYPKSHVKKVADSKKISSSTTLPIPTLLEAQQIVSGLDDKLKELMLLLPDNPKAFFASAKKAMDAWFCKWKHQERDDQQAITTMNSSADSVSELAVIDIEFAVSTTKPYNKAKNNNGNNKKCRFDIIAVDYVGQLYVIELKQNEVADSVDNYANVKVHKNDFDATIGNDVNRLFAQEMAQVVKIKKQLGILSQSIEVNTDATPIFAVAYSGEGPGAFNKKYRDKGICVIEVAADWKLRK